MKENAKKYQGPSAAVDVWTGTQWVRVERGDVAPPEIDEKTLGGDWIADRPAKTNTKEQE